MIMSDVSKAVPVTSLPKAETQAALPQSGAPSTTVTVRTAVEEVGARVGNFRWIICALLFFAATINYLDRQVIATLKGDLQRAGVWDEIGYSWVVFAFQGAYAVGLLGAGRVMDWLGTRKGFSLSVLFWSVAAMGPAPFKHVARFV